MTPITSWFACGEAGRSTDRAVWSKQDLTTRMRCQGDVASTGQVEDCGWCQRSSRQFRPSRYWVLVPHLGQLLGFTSRHDMYCTPRTIVFLRQYTEYAIYRMDNLASVLHWRTPAYESSFIGLLEKTLSKLSTAHTISGKLVWKRPLPGVRSSMDRSQTPFSFARPECLVITLFLTWSALDRTLTHQVLYETHESSLLQRSTSSHSRIIER